MFKRFKNVKSGASMMYDFFEVSNRLLVQFTIKMLFKLIYTYININ